MKSIALIITTWIVFGFYSCNRVKTKSHEVVEQAKQKAVEKRDDVINKVFRTFDSDKPDTKYNKLRFNEFFSFYPTVDVTGLYCYADELGIDSKYQFAFNCNTQTVDSIIKLGRLEKSTLVSDSSTEDSFTNKFTWWRNKDLNGLTPFWKIMDSNRVESILWYDTSLHKVYYLTYDY